LRKASILSLRLGLTAFGLAWLSGCAAPEATAPSSGASEPPSAPVLQSEVPGRAPTPIAVPKPPPPVPAEQTIATASAGKVESTVLFEFGKSELTRAAKGKLDREIVARLGEFASIDYVTVSGHADRVAPQRYNVWLSRARALAVKAYLVAQGVDVSKVGVFAFGELQPVKNCPEQRNLERLIECLTPNRRAVIVLRGRLK